MAKPDRKPDPDYDDTTQASHEEGSDPDYDEGAQPDYDTDYADPDSGEAASQEYYKRSQR